MPTTPETIAHRGFAGLYPENTIGAATAAAGYEETTMIEIDVQPASCGTPVVFHDDRLDGARDGRPTTDATGVVWETDLEALTEARVLGSDRTVPTLAALLEAVPDGVGVNVEMKNPGSDDLLPDTLLSERRRDERRAHWTPFVERVVADCDAFDGEILFSSFCEGALAAVRDVAPEYPAATLFAAAVEDGLAIARRYDCEAVHPPRNAIQGTALASESYGSLPAGEPSVDVLEVARDEGRAVNVWTVDTWVQYDQLATAGVDGIIADYPHLGSGVVA